MQLRLKANKTCSEFRALTTGKSCEEKHYALQADRRTVRNSVGHRIRRKCIRSRHRTATQPANAMNYDEIHTAKTAKAKAGDSQSLTTYTETLQGDHEANHEAVKALSSQKN